jgi:beta-1,4-N-acetylglucosaminyltransferase
MLFWLTIIFGYYLKSKFTIPFGKYGFAEHMPSALVILGSGGHSWEMFNFLSKIEWQRYLPIYVMANSDQYSLCDLNSFENCYKRNYFTERLTRPREHCHTSILSPIVLYRSIYCFLESIFIIYRYKPDYLVSNGPSICVPPTIAASFLKKLGLINTKILYIESAARVNTLSISGRILLKFVDYMFAFWKQSCYSYKLSSIYSSQLNDGNLNNNLNLANLKNFSKNTIKTALVTVGTTEFTELTNIALSENFEEFLVFQGFNRLIVQIGSLELYERITKRNNVSQLELEIIKILPSHKFSDILKKSDLVISHGGAATLLQSLTYGKKVIVVPNGRVSENHQLELVHKLYALNLIHVSSVDHLLDFLNENIKLIQSPVFPQFKMSLNESLRKAIGETQLTNENQDCIQNNKTENERQFSIVIPSTSHDREYLKNLLISLQKFLSLTSVDVILIIVPNSDFDQMKSFLSFAQSLWQKKLRLVKETKLIPDSILSKCDSFPKWRSGWFKQQVLKLSAAFIMKTDFYLILDSDCILTSPLKYCDLVDETENKTRSFYQTEDIYLHQNWWRGSAKLLGIESYFLDSLKEGIGVTPQILSVSIVKMMCSFIEKSHPNRGKWYSILSSFRLQLYPTAIWTEYTLYYLFAVRTGILNKYHICKRNALSDYNHNVWQLHQSYDWNPFIKTGNSSAFFTIFQSNTKQSHRISSAFLSQYIQNYSNHFISCLMILENRRHDLTLNIISSSIQCFCRQSWPSNSRELIISCEKKYEALVKDLIFAFNSPENKIKLIIADKSELVEKSLEIAIGNYISFWPYFCWSSPYRLSVQFQYLKDKSIESCHIFPFITGYPLHRKFYVTDDSLKNFSESSVHKMSLLCERNLIKSEKTYPESEALNEPTLLIEVNSNLCLKAKDNLNAVQNLQPIDSSSHFYELMRITGPFIDSLPNNIQRKHRRIYFISSELAFSPVIGGINTFLRVIISELKKNSIHLDNNIEFVFCGIQCGAIGSKN